MGFGGVLGFSLLSSKIYVARAVIPYSFNALLDPGGKCLGFRHLVYFVAEHRETSRN